MSSRKDIMAPRKKKDGGTYWVKLGTAWLNDNGGIQLVFDALPIPDGEGRVVANLFDPKQPQQGGGQQAGGYQQQQQQSDDLGSDSIPF